MEVYAKDRWTEKLKDPAFAAYYGYCSGRQNVICDKQRHKYSPKAARGRGDWNNLERRNLSWAP